MTPKQILISLESVLKLVEDNLDDILYPDEVGAIYLAKEYIKKNKKEVTFFKS